MWTPYLSGVHQASLRSVNSVAVSEVRFKAEGLINKLVNLVRLRRVRNNKYFVVLYLILLWPVTFLGTMNG